MEMASSPGVFKEYPGILWSDLNCIKRLVTLEGRVMQGNDVVIVIVERKQVGTCYSAFAKGTDEVGRSHEVDGRRTEERERGVQPKAA